MTFHFVYPNVLPRQEEFIGCGRYAIFPSGETPFGGYEEVNGVPNTPNKHSLNRATQMLAPESYDSTKGLFHKQDQKDRKYQGDSLDLAWFLAHNQRAGNLRFIPQSDIWCTGVLQVDGSGPHLLDVEQGGFNLKLRAFLDTVNPDLIFIVPLPNLTPLAHHMCREGGAQIMRLGKLESRSLKELTPGRKTVLAVSADELELLLEILFVFPESGKEKARGKLRKAAIFFVFLAILAVTVLVVKKYKQPVPLASDLEQEIDSPAVLPYETENIIADIRKGDFTTVHSFLASDMRNDSRELLKLRQLLTTPLSVESELQYLLTDDKQDDAAEEPDTDILVLTHRDFYRYHINLETPPSAMYLYLLQVDSAGRMKALFPSKQLNTVNPVRPWRWPVSIPEDDDSWIFLDPLPKTSRKLTQEIVYLLVSPWPAEDIEEMGLQLNERPTDEELKARLLARISVRDQADLPSIVCMRWSFLHGP